MQVDDLATHEYTHDYSGGPGDQASPLLLDLRAELALESPVTDGRQLFKDSSQSSRFYSNENDEFTC